MKKRLIVVVAIIIVMAITIGITGCQEEIKPGKQNQSNQSDSTNKTKGVTNTKYKIGVALVTLDEAYWKGNKAGLEKAAKDFGAELIFVNAQNNANDQMDQINSLISQKVDAIVCTPVDVESILPAVKKCNEAKIPFIFNDRITLSTESANVNYGVGYDIYGLSQMGAEWMVEYAQKNNTKLKILEVMGALTDSLTQYCTDGLAEVVEKNPAYLDVVTQIPGEWMPAKVLAGTVNALQSDNEINCIFYHSDFYHPSIVSALQQTGKWKKTGEQGHIVLAAAGGEKETLKDMKDGYVDLLEVFPTVEIGYQVIKSTIDLLNDKELEGEYKFISGFIVEPFELETKAEKIFGNMN